MNRFYSLLRTASFALLLFSCSDLTNLEKPKKISVKTSDQTYSVSAGKAAVLISDHFNATTLAENLNKKSEDSDSAASDALSKIAVYDYWPGGESSGSQQQQFLFHYPVATIPLDFGEYLNNLNLMGELSESLSQKITIPELSDVGFSQTVPLPDINALIAQKFTMTGLSQLQLPELPGTTLSLSEASFASIPVTVSAPSFESMLFSDGVMRLTVTRTDSVALSDDFVFTAVIQLLDSKGNVLAQSAETDLRSGGTVDISLASRRIVPSMTIRLTGSCGKGQLGKAHSYSLSPALVDPRVSKVTGLTLSAEDFGSAGRLDLGALSIPMSSLGSYLKTATVQEGGIRLYGLLPDGWSGVLCTAPITVADSGSLKVQFSDLAASDGKNYLLNKYADLAGQTIRAEQNVALSGSLSLALSNATLVLSDSGTQTVTLVGAVTVKTVSRAEIDMDELLGDRLAPVTKSKEMGDSVSKYVKQAVFNKIGAAATISTDLPVEELNFGATITSEMFAITQENAISDEVMIASGGSGTLDLITQEDWTCTVEPYEGMEADFTMQLSLTGSGGSSTVAFVNLVFGKEYSLDLSLELAYDWESVTLNLQATEDNNLAFSGTKETGLDLQNMLESYIKGEQKDLLDNVELDDKLTAYLIISRPVFTASADITVDPLALFPDFTGSVQAYTYSRGEAGAEPVRNEEPIELVPAGTELQLAYSQGDYAALADSRLCITKKLFLEPEANSGKPTYSAKIEGLLDILNSRPAGLDFEYAIGIGSSTAGEIKLTKAQVQSLISGGYAGSIDVSLDIVFPLGFKILGTADGKEKDGIVIDDLLDLAGQTLEEGEDLLKRDGPDSDVAEKFDKYGSIVSRFALSYVLDNNTGLSISAKAVLVKDEAGKATLVKDVFVDGKAHSFYLSNEEVKQVLACYPFQPKISMTVDPGVVTVPRNAQFSAEAKVSLTFDGTVTVYGDDD